MKKTGTFYLKVDRLFIVVVCFLLLILLSLFFGEYRVGYQYVDFANKTKYGTNCYVRYDKNYCINSNNELVEVKSFKKL